MQQIIPHLWFDKEATEAAAFYVTVFPESKVTHTMLLRDTPSGDCDLLSFELWGQEFMAISAGPLFKFNPSVSFMVHYDPQFFGNGDDAIQEARQSLDKAWEQLSEGGKALMPLQEYPFSKHYGWVQDKYGVSWQLMLTAPGGFPRPTIVPSLMFTGDKAGTAEEAGQFYVSVFRDAQPGNVSRYPAGSEPDQEGTMMYSDFRLLDKWFAAMDSAYPHGFDFNESISFMIPCADQQEIDYYWEKLSADPASEQCGWLKDKYGLSWQVTSEWLEMTMREGTQEQIDRITKALMPMKKIDIEALKTAAGLK